MFILNNTLWDISIYFNNILNSDGRTFSVLPDVISICSLHIRLVCNWDQFVEKCVMTEGCFCNILYRHNLYPLFCTLDISNVYRFPNFWCICSCFWKICEVKLNGISISFIVSASPLITTNTKQILAGCILMFYCSSHMHFHHPSLTVTKCKHWQWQRWTNWRWQRWKNWRG